MRRAVPGGQTLPAAGGGKAKVILLIVVIAVAAVGGYFGYAYISKPPQPTWPFKGAYAEYSANGTALIVPYQISVGITVLDFNSTATQFRLNYSITIAGQTQGNSTTRWVKSSAGATQSPFTPALAPGRVYNTTISLNGKTREVTAYEYTAQSATTIIYVSKQVPIPIQFKFTLSSATPFTFTINLTKTNIPALSS